jgi:hypothetical protein
MASQGGGKVAFTAQDDSYETRLSISFSNGNDT